MQTWCWTLCSSFGLNAKLFFKEHSRDTMNPCATWEGLQTKTRLLLKKTVNLKCLLWETLSFCKAIMVQLMLLYNISCWIHVLFCLIVGGDPPFAVWSGPWAPAGWSGLLISDWNDSETSHGAGKQRRRPTTVWEKDRYQGSSFFFIRHILNYTGYN